MHDGTEAVSVSTSGRQWRSAQTPVRVWAGAHHSTRRRLQRVRLTQLPHRRHLLQQRRGYARVVGSLAQHLCLRLRDALQHLGRTADAAHLPPEAQQRIGAGVDPAAMAASTPLERERLVLQLGPPRVALRASDEVDDRCVQAGGPVDTEACARAPKAYGRTQTRTISTRAA